MTAKAREQLKLSDDERISIILAGSWINLDHTDRVLATMGDLLKAPRGGRPPCLLIVGEANSGKSSLFDRFLKLNPPRADPLSQVNEAPVVQIEAPEGREPGAIYSRLLDAVFAPYKDTSKPEAKRRQVVKLFADLKVRVVLIDEIHNALSGTAKQREGYLIALKTLTNVAKVNIVAAGIQTARTLFSQDEQFTSRFDPFELPRWTTDERLGNLLVTLENRMPLAKPSFLSEPGMLMEIDRRSEGNLGDIIALVKVAAVAAIRDPKRPEHISIAALKAMKWSASSDRKAFSRRLMGGLPASA